MVVAGKFIAEVGVVEVVEKLSAEVVADGVVVVADVEKVDVGTGAEAGALKNIGADVEAGTLKGVAAVVGVKSIYTILTSTGERKLIGQPPKQGKKSSNTRSPMISHSFRILCTSENNILYRQTDFL